MANNYWLEQEEVFLKTIENVKVPNRLKKCMVIELKC